MKWVWTFNLLQSIRRWQKLTLKKKDMEERMDREAVSFGIHKEFEKENKEYLA
jgi:hypothetical protein